MRKLINVLLGVFAVQLVFQIQAVPVGPKLEEELSAKRTVANEIGPSYSPLAIPSLDVAVVVLDPNLEENDDEMNRKGIWPEVRKSEGIRSAYRIKEALIRLNQFESVKVVPSPNVSADLYLRGKIERSTSEIMEIRWNLMDARGVNWVNWRTSDHRVSLGWHQRFYEPNKDAFQPLWNEIAADVYQKLREFARKHASTVKQNEKRIRRGKSRSLSTLDEITYVRDLSLARALAPQIYQDSLRENKRSEWEIAYIPDQTTPEWLRVQAFSELDDKVVGLYDSQYDSFFTEINPEYETWLNQVFPYARRARLEKRRATIETIVGGVVLAAAAAKAADAPNSGAAENALTAGAVIGGGLIFKGLMDRKDFKESLSIFDEISRNYHDSFKSTNLEIEGMTHTLTGTASKQLRNWRAMLIELYNIDETSASDIRIVEKN